MQGSWPETRLYFVGYRLKCLDEAILMPNPCKLSLTLIIDWRFMQCICAIMCVIKSFLPGCHFLLMSSHESIFIAFMMHCSWLSDNHYITVKHLCIFFANITFHHDCRNGLNSNASMNGNQCGERVQNNIFKQINLIYISKSPC